jgi:hypothetical protein
MYTEPSGILYIRSNIKDGITHLYNYRGDKNGIPTKPLFQIQISPNIIRHTNRARHLQELEKIIKESLK